MSEPETRRKLVEAAERLFAERGIDNVSLREINRAAGQRNVAALHYHFGNREGLLEAIFEHRMSEIDRRRLEMLEDIEGNGNTASIRAVVEAMVLPLAEKLNSGTGDAHYIRFLASAIGDPGVDVGELVRDKFDHGMVQTRRLARRLLTEIPPEIVDLRITLAANFMVHALSDMARQIAADARRAQGLPFFIANLTDSIVGAVSAPASETTMQQLADVNREPT